MTNEGFCEKHGPYDSAYGRCPYCARERGLPPEPPPLEDEMPTDPFGAARRAFSAGDEDDTDARGWAARTPAEDEEDDLTQLPQRRRAARDEDDLTMLPQRRRTPFDDSDDTVVDRAETGLLGFLIVKQGMRRGQVHRIRDGSTIGRSDVDLILQDVKVSRAHAKLTVEHGQFVIWDFGSRNGTLVNGQRIREATALSENDEIQVGDTVFVLKTLA